MPPRTRQGVGLRTIPGSPAFDTLRQQKVVNKKRAIEIPIGRSNHESATCNQVPSLPLAVKPPAYNLQSIFRKLLVHHLQESLQPTICSNASSPQLALKFPKAVCQPLAVKFPAYLHHFFRQLLVHPLQYSFHRNSGKRNLPAYARQVDIAMQFGTQCRARVVKTSLSQSCCGSGLALSIHRVSPKSKHCFF